MIKIIGNDSGLEAEAAQVLKDAAARAWPWICEDPHSHIWIFPNVQCYGQKPQDLDIVVLALLDPARALFQPTVDLFDMYNNRVDATQVQVRSLCLCIELKSHGPDGVRFDGNKVEVHYHGTGWKSATQQNEKQKYSLKNYLEKHMRGARIPHICNLIWLWNIPREELPKSTNNLLPASFTWSGLLNAVASNQCVWPQGGNATSPIQLPTKSRSRWTTRCRSLACSSFLQRAQS
ncbi:MAG: hypothetical protein JKX70_06410 [Phycisphaerales bacterium]|nr:hypothetical protein [Phycisphaerales bacterium]